MTLYLPLWIFIYGSLLLSQCTTGSTDTTSTDSSILNLVIETLTTANFDKQLKTTIHNSSDSFSSNNVNTGSLHSTTEECKTGDCTKLFFTSSSTDNSSSASKILWNLVSTVKSTTIQPSVSDEINFDESTVPSLNSPVNPHISNHSNVHNSTFYSNDNELDSEISYDNSLPEVHSVHSNEVQSNAVSSQNFTTATSTERAIIITEIPLYELGSFEENDTSVEAREVQSQMVTFDRNVSDILNVSEYTTVPNTQETTIYKEDELGFTTHFADPSSSSDASNPEGFSNEMNTHVQNSEKSTSGIPYSESYADESSTLSSVNYDVSMESEELKSKDIETMAVSNLELHSASHTESNVPVTEEIENRTLLYVDYDTSLESEELQSKEARMININKTLTSPVISDTSVSVWTSEEIPDTTATINVSSDVPNSATSVSVWTSDEMPNTTTTMNLNSDVSYSAETFDNHLEAKPAGTSDSGYLNENTTPENTDLNHFITTSKVLWRDMTTNDSMESTEGIYYIFNPNQETTKSTNHSPSVSEYASTLDNSSDISMDKLSLNENVSTAIAYSESSEVASISLPQVNTTDDIFSTVQNFTGDSSEIAFDSTNSHDLTESEMSNQNTSAFARSLETEYENEKKTSHSSEQAESSVTANTDPNINVVYLNTVPITSTQASHDLNEIDNNLSSVQTNHGTIVSDSKFVETSSLVPLTTDDVTVPHSRENSFVEEITVTPRGFDISTESTFYTEVSITDQEIEKSSTNVEGLENETISKQRSDATLITTDRKTEHSFSTTEDFDKLGNATEYPSLGMHSENTGTVTSERTKSFNAESVSTSEHTSTTTEHTAISHSESAITENDINETSLHHSEEKKSTTNEDETMTEVFSESGPITDAKHVDTIPISSTREAEISPTSSEVSSISVTETHREGKHIPFSSTLVRSTTPYPRIFSVTIGTHSRPPQPETTETNFLLNCRVKAEELSTEEKENLINGVVTLSDRYYSNEELNKITTSIHLWMLRVIADGYKNVTSNLSGSNNGTLDEIEFENLPEILYVLPTPKIYSPNISFTFFAHKWRNETYPVDIMLTILNLQKENLRHILTDIEEIRFSHALLVQKHDSLFAFMEEDVILYLSICLITVGIILLVICAVTYYRRKTRHSAHCLTDDKLHRNMQEAMGLDLNPAVIILQEEIREKAALNGNKICSLDDDEGWLAPIGDVPLQDNNAPFVQDTKL